MSLLTFPRADTIGRFAVVGLGNVSQVNIEQAMNPRF